jgi:hypothetical protein
LKERKIYFAGAHYIQSAPTKKLETMLQWLTKLSTAYGCEIIGIYDEKNPHNFDDPIKETVSLVDTMKKRIQSSNFVFAFYDEDKYDSLPDMEIIVAENMLKDVFIFAQDVDLLSLQFYPYLSPYVAIYSSENFVESFGHFIENNRGLDEEKEG